MQKTQIGEKADSLIVTLHLADACPRLSCASTIEIPILFLYTKPGDKQDRGTGICPASRMCYYTDSNQSWGSGTGTSHESSKRQTIRRGYRPCYDMPRKYVSFCQPMVLVHPPISHRRRDVVVRVRCREKNREENDAKPERIPSGYTQQSPNP